MASNSSPTTSPRHSADTTQPSSKPCSICGNQTGNRIIGGRAQRGDRDRWFDYLLCGECSCFQIIEIPSDLASFYSAESGYYSFQRDPYERMSRWQRGVDRLSDFAKYRILSSVPGWARPPAWQRRWVSTVQWRRDMQILDVGCGNGFFLRSLERQGFQHLLGIDPFLESDSIQVGTNCVLQQKSIDQVDGSFDLILLSHSLEHAPDQHETAANIKRLLKPDGQAIILIPVYSEYFLKRYGDCWFAWDIPIHLFLHSPQSLSILAGQHGLRVDQSVHHALVNCLQDSERRLADETADERARERIKNWAPSDWQSEIDRLDQESKSDCCNFVLRHDP